MSDSETKAPGELNIEKETEGKVYEVGYLLVPTMTEEEVPAEYSNLKDLIASLGGEVISDDMPRMMSLAYTMYKVIANVRSKFDSAYFGWTKFTMAPDKVVELKKKLDLNDKFLRFLIIKTVKENTIAAKRYVARATYTKPAPRKEGDAPVEINKEEIDKEIDAMVSVE